MNARSTLVLAILWSGAISASGQDQPPIPELRVPGANADHRPDDVVHRFGSMAYRHQGVGPASFSAPEPFFSPDGDTVYVPGNSGLLALDRATGRVKFHYRYSLHNVGIQDEGRAGVRVNFHQGPLAGQFALLEHGTGRELSRGKQAVVANAHFVREFDDGRRAVATRGVRRPDPRGGSRDHPTTGLFDLTTGKELAELGDGGPDARNPAFSRDKRRLAFCTDAMELRLFETQDGRLLRSIPLGLRRGERGAPRLSDDGKTAFFWRRVGPIAEIVALDVETGDTRVLVKVPRSDVERAPSVSRDARLLAYPHFEDSGASTSVWRILRLSDPTEVHRVDARPGSTLGAFSPDSQAFWLLSSHGVARFDLASGKLDPAAADALFGVDAMSFSADGARLYAVGGARRVVWDVATGGEIEPRTGFDDLCRNVFDMRCLHVGDDGRRTFWAGRHDNDALHALLDGRKVAGFYALNMTVCQDFDLSADHRLLIHNASQNELRLCDVWKGTTIRELLPRDRNSRKTSHMALSPDGRTMAVAQYDQGKDLFRVEVEVDVELWSCEQGKKTGSFRTQGNLSLPMRFSQDARELRIWSDTHMSVWNVADRALVRRRAEPMSSYLIAETPNRHWQLRYRYRPGGVRQIELVDVHSAKTARVWDHPPGHITAVAFSPGNHWMATASVGGVIDLRHFHAARPEAAALRDRTVPELVDRLADDEPAAAFDALCELIRRGDEALPGIRSAIAKPPTSAKQIASWIKQLDSAEFDERDAASRKLLAAGSDALGPLRAALEAGGALEKTTRVRQLITRLRDGDIPRETLKSIRVVEALAAIRTEAAMKQLAELSKGDERLAITHEARATLAR